MFSSKLDYLLSLKVFLLRFIISLKYWSLQNGWEDKGIMVRENTEIMVISLVFIYNSSDFCKSMHHPQQRWINCENTRSIQPGINGFLQSNTDHKEKQTSTWALVSTAVRDQTQVGLGYVQSVQKNSTKALQYIPLLANSSYHGWKDGTGISLWGFSWLFILSNYVYQLLNHSNIFKMLIIT